MRQVIENTESTERQYGLRQRAVALGWSSDAVVVGFRLGPELLAWQRPAYPYPLHG
jgi:hypothetical protein